MKIWPRAILVTFIVLTLTAGAWAQLAEKKVLTLAAAKQIASAAEEEAAKNKFTMVIVIVDDGGVQQTLPSAQLVRPSGEAARFSFPVHPHMFRHACG